MMQLTNWVSVQVFKKNEIDHYRLRGVKTQRVLAILITYYYCTGSPAAIFAARPCFCGSPLHGQEDYRPGVLGAY